MAYFGVHKLATFNGTSWGQETFTFGLRFLGSDVPTQAMADALHAAAKTLFREPNVNMHPAHHFNYVKVAQIDINGKYPPGHTPVESVAEDVAGIGQNINTQAPQVALCITTTTSKLRGRASQGRFYLPSGAWAHNNTGVLANGPTSANAINGYKAFLNSCNAAGAGSLAVLSKLDGSWTPITGIRVGQRYDVQRSRGRNIPESYVAAAL